MKRACSIRSAPYDVFMNQDENSGRKLGYVRVSDKDQTEALQLDALKAAGCELIFTDHGVSGTKTRREGLDDLLATLTKGDTLVVWKLDRLGRSTIHLLQVLNDLRDRGVGFLALTQGIDTRTAVGRMIYGQLAVFAEYERSLISERTKAGMAAARDRGCKIGRPRRLSASEARACARRIASEAITCAALARELDVSPQTLHRAIRDCQTV